MIEAITRKELNFISSHLYNRSYSLFYVHEGNLALYVKVDPYNPLRIFALM